MYVRKYFPFLWLLPLCLSACSGMYRVEGTTSISHLDSKMMYIRSIQDGEWVTIDSAEVIHGHFSMKGAVDSTQMASLYLDEQNLMPIVLESGKIKLTISDTELSARGTKYNETLYDFIIKRNELERRLEELSDKETRMVIEGGDIVKIQQQLMQEQDSLAGAMDKHIKGFISRNYENVLGPGIFIMLCHSLPYPMITPRMEDVLKDAPYSFKNNALIKEYLKVARENMQLLEEKRLLEHRAMGVSGQ